jgi:tetraacyldisaccharide 4'-kinase
MIPSGLDNFARELLSGRRRGLGPTLLRAILAAAEPFYAAAMSLRNAAYARGFSHRLPRPVISVGNLTTGGTGKTPVVAWLAGRLIERGLRPAVLMRGYRADRTGGSDEQRMLAAQLGPAAVVIANPDRIAGAAEAMRAASATSPAPSAPAPALSAPAPVRGPMQERRTADPPDAFILDDGFQHRRVARDFDLVLIHAAEPFGFDHVLPRGLLREPLRGLRRADAVLITHCELVTAAQREALAQRLGAINSRLRIFRAAHAHAALLDGESRHPMDALASTRFFVFAGIGDPRALAAQLPGRCGQRWFGDHHAYSQADVAALNAAARDAGAQVLVTTAKDWIKLASLTSDLPIWRLELHIAFCGDDESALLEAIVAAINPAPPDPPAASPAPPLSRPYTTS